MSYKKVVYVSDVVHNFIKHETIDDDECKTMNDYLIKKLNITQPKKRGATK